MKHQLTISADELELILTYTLFGSLIIWQEVYTKENRNGAVDWYDCNNKSVRISKWKQLEEIVKSYLKDSPDLPINSTIIE